MNRKLHVGCSPLTGTIFAGTVLKDGRTGGTGTQDVTIDALVAVAEHATKFGRPVEITGPDGKLEYRITVEAFLAANKAMIGASHLNKAADTIDTIDTLRAQLAEAQRRIKELETPTMFWDFDNPEHEAFDSPYYAICDGDFDEGEEVSFMTARALPTKTVRVTRDSEGGYDYEYIDAARGGSNA